MKTLQFKTAFKYPFNRAIGMLNILWILIPIIGWFALGGYGIRIIQEFSKGKYEKLPVLKFGDDLQLGFFMFFKAIPFMFCAIIVIAILNAIGPLGKLIEILLEIFVFPILGINFANKMTVGSFFEFGILKYVFNNLWDYIVAILKAILLWLVYLPMWIILVGFPAQIFSNNMFLADFYRRRVK
ncbi:MAG: DUF4013 domain-containing protein [Candidatus Margulisbacteria bacterium]|nr:DUF4013 domain-containing protein [Candidatus Margulisiibacteriota bacterium]MBU1021790.1 DUF4013 domain-containing protein [Candidatus Margulisiibacteriota bacterium]MBU1729536.1 DUF4013 domain-containing protein [Candidatus Margulisiibacteriota bacterium]MBU1955363.1 DUF4013 domain-containing protein [Candidatus Margulisiibacteriota bacterium]